MPLFSKVKDIFKSGSSAKKKKVYHNVKLENPEEYWSTIGELGDGAYGKVYKVCPLFFENKFYSKILMYHVNLSFFEISVIGYFKDSFLNETLHLSKINENELTKPQKIRFVKRIFSLYHCL